MLRHWVAISWVLFATGAAAEPSALSGDAIKETFTGAVIEVDTPLGVKLPIQYLEDGRLSGEARGLAYILGAPSDTGKWWVSSDRLCHKWSKWFDGVLQCMRLSRAGSRLYWRRDDGETGTAVISTPARVVARAPVMPAALGERDVPRSDSSASSLAGTSVLPRAIPREVAQVEEATQTEGAFAKSSMSVAPVLQREPAPVKRTVDTPRQVEPKPQVLPPSKVARQTSPAEPKDSLPARPVQSFRVWGVAMNDVLNVRNGPSTEHMATGAIPPDALGIRIMGGCVAEWCPISHRGVRGWVNSFYLIEDVR